jgi:hypothetical protein
MICWRTLSLSFLLCAAPGIASAQTTRLSLSAITAGTENVQLVYNGDFQFQGPLLTNTHPTPVGWIRLANMFADPGTNMAATDSGVVARASVSGGAAVCMYQRTITLEPNSAYVLSAYLWNTGNSANHVSTVVDMNDVNQEPQITLSWSDATRRDQAG